MNKPIIQVNKISESEPTGLVDRTINDIRFFIKENELGIGDALPSETAISKQFAVSRTVAREALRALAAIGILDVGNGRRARVAEPDADALSLILDHTVYTGQLSIQQTLDLRRTLELRTASLAALRRTDKQARELLEIVEQMLTKLDEPNELMELDIKFHGIIALASGNALYSIIINSFSVITRQTWNIGWNSRGTQENRRENILCHERIAKAIMIQDPVRAEAEISEHFDSAVNVLLKAGIT